MYSKSLNTSKNYYKVVCNQLKDVAAESKLLAPVLKNIKCPNPKEKTDHIKESSLPIEQEWNFQVKVSIVYNVSLQVLIEAPKHEQVLHHPMCYKMQKGYELKLTYIRIQFKD